MVKIILMLLIIISSVLVLFQILLLLVVLLLLPVLLLSVSLSFSSSSSSSSSSSHRHRHHHHCHHHVLFGSCSSSSLRGPRNLRGIFAECELFSVVLLFRVGLVKSCRALRFLDVLWYLWILLPGLRSSQALMLPSFFLH